jgi:hypothetical protein
MTYFYKIDTQMQNIPESHLWGLSCYYQDNVFFPFLLNIIRQKDSGCVLRKILCKFKTENSTEFFLYVLC